MRSLGGHDGDLTCSDPIHQRERRDKDEYDDDDDEAKYMGQDDRGGRLPNVPKHM